MPDETEDHRATETVVSFRDALERHALRLEALAELDRPVESLITEATTVLRGGGKILFFGNGGSAAQAQHFATELVGRFGRSHRPLPGLALNADTAVLTALANDHSFAEIFALQIEALAGPGDLAIGLSTSGDSENVIRGLASARRQGCRTAALLGLGADGRGGRAAAHADHALIAPVADAAGAQECHLLIAHYLLDRLDRELADGD